MNEARAGAVAPRFDEAVKRLFDVCVASLLLVSLSPLMLLVTVAIKLDSRGPVLYRGARVGHRGAEFRMLKFRKMRESASGPALTVSSDSRFTRVGRFLALSKLDELPQLWNIVRGDMSLVGPRPEDPLFVALYPEEYVRITLVRPGVTGLSQLAFARESQILDLDDPLGHYIERLLPQKIRLDQLYVERRTLALDLRIVVWTIAAVLLRRHVAVHRETGKLNLRRRPNAPQRQTGPECRPIARQAER